VTASSSLADSGSLAATIADCSNASMRLSPILLIVTLSAGLAHAQGYPNTRSAYLDMMDSDGDGRIGVAEYVDYMSAGFRRMDSNGDGILETGELPGGRGHSITLQAYQDNLRQQFHKLDRNHDGYLSAKELTAPPR
jgi:Ca2+-binding EF-hand superfamily protein